MRSALLILFVGLAIVAATEEIDDNILEDRAGCPKKCSQNEAPVCGFNGNCYRWFTNKCLLKSHNCVSKDLYVRCDNSLCQQCCRVN